MAGTGMTAFQASTQYNDLEGTAAATLHAGVSVEDISLS